MNRDTLGLKAVGALLVVIMICLVVAEVVWIILQQH